MKQPSIPSLVLAGALALGVSGTAFAQSNDALLDALVRKKVLSAGEAEDIRVELANERVESDNSKLSLSKSVSELKLGGDLRLRYQYDNRKERDVTPWGPGAGFPNHGKQRSRERFRLRLNADFKLTDQFFGGVTLQTGGSADSANQTFGNGFGNYDIFLSRAFVGWQPTEGLTFLGGKVSNPFYTTDLVWDGDINPSGAVEIIDFHKLFGGGVAEEVVTTTDGKQVVTSTTTKVSEPAWFLSLRAGQFIFSDNDEDAFDNDASDDAWLFVTQLVGGYQFNKNTKLTLGPGFMVYNAAEIKSAPNETAFYNNGTVPTGAARDLAIITAPGDFQFKIAGVKTKILWDFAYNANGGKRATEIYGMNGVLGTSGHSSRDDIAWLAGFQIGENKKKGDLSFLANYRQTGMSAVDPNLNDSDFALGQLNSQGWKVGLAYNLTDFAVVGATYMNASRLRKDYVGGQATGNQKLAYLNSVDLFQLDLNVKF